MKFNKLYNLIENVFQPASPEELGARKETAQKSSAELWVEKLRARRGVTENPDGSFDVMGDVFIAEQDKLPVSFTKIHGRFTASNLKSLEGCPKEVGDDCVFTILETSNLKNAPEIIQNNFEVGIFSGKFNSLTGCPKKVGGDFVIRYNRDAYPDTFKKWEIEHRCDVGGKIKLIKTTWKPIPNRLNTYL